MTYCIWEIAANVSGVNYGQQVPSEHRLKYTVVYSHIPEDISLQIFKPRSTMKLVLKLSFKFNSNFGIYFTIYFEIFFMPSSIITYFDFVESLQFF